MKRLDVMKTVSAVLALLFFVFIAANPLFAGETKSVTLKVEGMTCSLCPKMVKKALSGIEGVKAVQVSFEKKEAFVEYDEGKTNVQAMIKVVDRVGYKANFSGEGR